TMSDSVAIGSTAGSVITLSFPTDASFYGPAASYDSIQSPAHNFGALSSTQQWGVWAALTPFVTVTDLGFMEINETATNHAVMRFALSDAEANPDGTPAAAG